MPEVVCKDFFEELFKGDGRIVIGGSDIRLADRIHKIDKKM